MTAGPDDVEIIAVVDPEQFDGAVQQLEAAGVTVYSRDRAIGTVSGRVGTQTPLDSLTGLDGVLAVEPSRTIAHPDPGSELQ